MSIVLSAKLVGRGGMPKAELGWEIAGHPTLYCNMRHCLKYHTLLKPKIFMVKEFCGFYGRSTAAKVSIQVYDRCKPGLEASSQNKITFEQNLVKLWNIYMYVYPLKCLGYMVQYIFSLIGCTNVFLCRIWMYAGKYSTRNQQHWLLVHYVGEALSISTNSQLSRHSDVVHCCI